MKGSSSSSATPAVTGSSRKRTMFRMASRRMVSPLPEEAGGLEQQHPRHQNIDRHRRQRRPDGGRGGLVHEGAEAEDNGPGLFGDEAGAQAAE